MLKWTAAVAALVLGVGLWAFEPWRLFTNSEVNEALPSVSGVAADTGTASEEPTTEAEPGHLEKSKLGATGARKKASSPRQAPTPEPVPATKSPTPEPEPTPEVVELASGPFETAEHATSGRARVIELRDGSRYLRLDGLTTSDGPDLYMWITDQPSGGSWGSYDDGRYVRLGALKANSGNQNYEISADADLSGMRSVVIWCDRFNVAFGTAPISL